MITIVWVIGVCFLNLLVPCTAANPIGHYAVGVVAMDDSSTFQYYLTELFFQHFYERRHLWHPWYFYTTQPESISKTIQPFCELHVVVRVKKPSDVFIDSEV